VISLPSRLVSFGSPHDPNRISSGSNWSTRRFVNVGQLARSALWPVGPDNASVHSIA
jgi:hypothetical protein